MKTQIGMDLKHFWCVNNRQNYLTPDSSSFKYRAAVWYFTGVIDYRRTNNPFTLENIEQYHNKILD